NKSRSAVESSKQNYTDDSRPKESHFLFGRAIPSRREPRYGEYKDPTPRGEYTEPILKGQVAETPAPPDPMERALWVAGEHPPVACRSSLTSRVPCKCTMEMAGYSGKNSLNAGQKKDGRRRAGRLSSSRRTIRR